MNLFILRQKFVLHFCQLNVKFRFFGKTVTVFGLSVFAFIRKFSEIGLIPNHLNIIEFGLSGLSGLSGLDNLSKLV